MTKLSDEQVIRRAVELAPGWSIQDSVVTPPWPLELFRITDVGASPVFLDALAAELVRTVDTLDGLRVFTRPALSSVAEEDWPYFEKHASSGPDRTMNTLRAIVESGALDE